jgi:hypothetical protein
VTIGASAGLDEDGWPIKKGASRPHLATCSVRQQDGAECTWLGVRLLALLTAG